MAFIAIQYEPLTLFSGAYEYPDWGEILGWMMVAGVVGWIPIFMVIQWARYGGLKVCRIKSIGVDENVLAHVGHLSCMNWLHVGYFEFKQFY